MDSNEGGADMSEVLEAQSNLSNRISWFEESVNLNYVNESLDRIIRLEEPVGHGHVGESLRECYARVNQRAADLERLENRMRTQKLVS